MNLPQLLQLLQLPQTWHQLMRQHPACWPPLPRCILCLAVFLLPLLSGWLLYLAPAMTALATAAQEETQLKANYQRKLQQAATLALLHMQQESLHQRIAQHAQQLFDNDDAGAWLEEITAIAARHQLRLEQATPAPAMNTAHYLVLPLQLRLLGRYHDIGRFAATLAAGPRTRILSNLQLSSGADDRADGRADSELLRLEASVLSYRRRPSEPTP